MTKPLILDLGTLVRRSGLAILLALGLLSGACERTTREGETAPDSSVPGPAAEGETIVVAYAVDMRDVNELTADATPVHTMLHYFALFDPLLAEQADYQDGPPSFKPRLAKSYEFSEDRRQLTFHLRRDAVWSDGVPITAEDVRWSWQAQVSPEVGWAFSESKRYISDVEVVDEHTVRYHFTRAYATQLLDANFGVPLPKHVWSQLPFDQWRTSPSWFVDHLVTSGPFVLESWEPQQRFVLRRNQRYYEPGVPRTERIVFQVTPDRASRLALLRSGQAHLLELEVTDAATVEADPNLEILSYIPRQYNCLSWNVSRPLFAEKEVRQALTMAIDRQEIIDALYHGFAQLTYSPYMSNIWAHNKDLEVWPYDPGRAKQLLAAQGWVDTDGDGILDRDGQPFRFELVTNADNRLRRNIVVMVQEHLKRIGVDVAQLRFMEFNTLLSLELAHDFDASLVSMGIDTSLNLSYFFHSKSAGGDGYNFGVYSNPEVDRTLEELQAQVDPMLAKPLYDRLQALLREDQPVTFLYEPRRVVGISKSLHNVNPNAITTYFYLRDWELRETD
ncbi:MAG: hypothetical protein GY856_03345 [bacterium]|nr:hypothetical protein [bacterium]